MPKENPDTQTQPQQNRIRTKEKRGEKHPKGNLHNLEFQTEILKISKDVCSGDKRKQRKGVWYKRYNEGEIDIRNVKDWGIDIKVFGVTKKDIRNCRGGMRKGPSIMHRYNRGALPTEIYDRHGLGDRRYREN